MSLTINIVYGIPVEGKFQDELEKWVRNQFKEKKLKSWDDIPGLELVPNEVYGLVSGVVGTVLFSKEVDAISLEALSEMGVLKPTPAQEQLALDNLNKFPSEPLKAWAHKPIGVYIYTGAK